MSGAARTTCPYCGVGCGVVVAREETGAVAVRGDPEHPANFGRLCSKGSALAETIGLEDRLLHPAIDGRPASWDEAIKHVAEGFSRAVAEHGPDSVAFYVSGQLLTEDYYVVNKLAKGFIGTANIDTNSRLCMASSVAGHKRAFGADVVPGNYEDLVEADYVVFVGSNAAWCHPVLYQRIAAAKAANPAMRVVVVDPRRTDACAIADLHLPLRPGSDAVLFDGLLAHLARKGAINQDFVSRHTHGAPAALAAAQRFTPERVAEICGLPPGAVEMFFDGFARHEKTVTLYSQGINQSSSGVDKVNSILNCHLLTGRIGRPGMGPFSLTGQPNAMGGREVGGLANQLAAHMELDNPVHRDRVRRFWDAPRVAERAGLKAVELFEAIEAGRIRALWIMATNPLVSLPDSDRAKAALKRCPLVVVSDCVATNDTLSFAHVALPATGWGEKDGTVTNSERRISRQRRFLAAPGEARDDWRIVCDVARAMGYSGFDHANAAAVFREHAALSGFENEGERAFDISGLAEVCDADYDALAPVQWPAPKGGAPAARLFAEGGFFTRDRRARLVPITPRPPQGATSEDYPLILNTGRVRDHWHTLTRTGRSARLSAHVFEPYVEIHPVDAKRFGLADEGLARLESAQGAMIARVRVAGAQRRGCLFAPMHWSDANGSQARVNALVAAHVDPISGQPESKQTPVRIAPFEVAWQGFALTRARIAAQGADYWVAGRGQDHWRLELAGGSAPQDWQSFARDLFAEDSAGEWLAYRDIAAGAHRFAVLSEGRLQACLFIGGDKPLPSRSWLGGLFALPKLAAADRLSLLAGRPRDAGADVGAIVCSCFGVGRRQIETAIAAGASSVEAVGARLKAGTNCGSCKSEISGLLAAQPRVEAAAARA
jgi:assimilatory nitrate reductase catalytic subunit